jgi:hypothetical protein
MEDSVMEVGPACKVAIKSDEAPVGDNIAATVGVNQAVSIHVVALIANIVAAQDIYQTGDINL